jgi:hypothetical protein
MNKTLDAKCPYCNWEIPRVDKQFTVIRNGVRRASYCPACGKLITLGYNHEEGFWATKPQFAPVEEGLPDEFDEPSGPNPITKVSEDSTIASTLVRVKENQDE